MDAKRRKLGTSRYVRNTRPGKLIDDEEFGGFQDEASDSGSEDYQQLRASKRHKEESKDSEEDGEEDDAEESEDEGEDEGEDEEDDDDDAGEAEESESEPESEAPASPSEGLTFGQILQKREKTAAKGKHSPAARDGASSKIETEDKKERPSKPKPASRSSKHAPAEVSARYAVKRGRDWTAGDATIAGVDVRPAAARARDPRFFLASMSAPASRNDELRTQRNYAFLDEYRDSEVQQLRETVQAAERAAKAARKKVSRRNKDGQARVEEAEREVAALRRTLTSMEARKKDREAKAQQAAVLEAHKKEERERVRQGKQPYYLKKSEQQKRILLDKFAGMTPQQVDKTIDRRRKKAASRERREMPLARRT